MAEISTPWRLRLGAYFAGCLGLILIGVLTLILLVVIFYAEENWRGDLAWQQTRGNLIDQGENLDPSNFVPAPVPDEENFGTLPFFAEKSIAYPGSSKATRILAIRLTLKSVTDHLPLSAKDTKPGSLPFLGNWQRVERTDSDLIRKQLEAFLHNQNPHVSIHFGATPSELFALICPIIGELRSASATHPACRFEHEYGTPRPWKAEFSTTTDLITIAKVLSYDAQLELISGHSDLVLEDFRVEWKIRAAVAGQPNLVSGLVGLAIVLPQFPIINQGLVQHIWNDHQLTALDQELGKIDSLSASQFCLRGEAARFSLPLINYYSSHRGEWLKSLLLVDSILQEDSPTKRWSLWATCWVIPSGWFDLAKAHEVPQLLSYAKATDPAAHRAYPSALQKDDVSSDPAIRWMSFITTDSGAFARTPKNYIYLQVEIDEARIGCRLERYHLVHGHYPSTLDVLENDYGKTPTDVLSGNAYVYRLHPNGTYLLYSVGWNQTDDQGNAGLFRNSDSPDWIWTNYPNSN